MTCFLFDLYQSDLLILMFCLVFNTKVQLHIVGNFNISSYCRLHWFWFVDVSNSK